VRPSSAVLRTTPRLLTAPLTAMCGVTVRSRQLLDEGGHVVSLVRSESDADRAPVAAGALHGGRKPDLLRPNVVQHAPARVCPWKARPALYEVAAAAARITADPGNSLMLDCRGRT